MSERTALNYLNNWRNANWRNANAKAKVTELEEQIAKLQAERDVLHGALMKAGGLADIERWPERYPLVYGCMTDAIKEVECQCQHHFFGDQVTQRRCVKCNRLEVE